MEIQCHQQWLIEYGGLFCLALEIAVDRESAGLGLGKMGS